MRISARINALAALLTLGLTPLLALEPTESRLVKLNGMQMYYETFGQGEPLLIIHGFTSSSQGWHPYIDSLAAHYRLILPDMRGHGRSTNPSNRFTHRQSALDMFALLDSLHIGQFKAIGASSGGMTLLHMATSQPSRVESMILVGATSYFPEQARRIMRRTDPDSLTPERLAGMAKIHMHGPEQARALIAEFHAFKDSYDDVNFTPPYLSTITAPTLIIDGDRDEFFPVDIQVGLYQAIPHSYLWIVPNGGHFPVDSRVLPEFERVTLEFLRGDWGN